MERQWSAGNFGQRFNRGARHPPNLSKENHHEQSSGKNRPHHRRLGRHAELSLSMTADNESFESLTQVERARLSRCPLDLPYFDPSGFAASAIFTAEPSMMESDGSRITVSSDVKPDNTSTLLP